METENEGRLKRFESCSLDLFPLNSLQSLGCFYIRVFPCDSVAKFC